MTNKKYKVIFWISTVLLTILLLFSVGNYIFNNEIFSAIFIKLGYPSYLIYPLSLLKILGLITIWTKNSKTLKEWAYAGFFFNFTLAISAHLNINDGAFPFPLIALILLLTSYYTEKKAFRRDESVLE